MSFISLRYMFLGGCRNINSRILYRKTLELTRNATYYASKCNSNYQRLPYNSTEIRNYSSTSNLQNSPKEKEKGREELNSYYISLVDSAKANHRVNYEDVKRLLTAMEQNGVDPDYAEYVIKCCGDLMPDKNVTIKLNLVKQIMLLLEQKKHLNINHFHAMLQTYYENGVNVSVNDIIAKIDSLGISPNEKTFQKLLMCVCNCGDVNEALAIINRMKELTYVMTDNMFNALILGYAMNGDMINAGTVMDTMLTSLVPQSEETFTSLLEGMASDDGHVYKIPELLRDLRTKGITFTVEQKLKIIKRLAMSGNHKYIHYILMDDRQILTSPLMERFCINLIHSGASKAAIVFYNEVHKNTTKRITGKDEDEDTYAATFIREMVKIETNINTVIEVCVSLIESDQNKFALHIATETALRYGLPSALQLIQSIKHHGMSVRPHYLWPLIITTAKKSGEQGVFSILNKMRYLSVSVDPETLEHYVLTRIKIQEPELAIRKLQDAGLSISVIITPLLTQLIRQKSIAKALQVIEKYNRTVIDVDQIIKPLVNCYADGSCSERTTRLLLHFVNNSEYFKKLNAKTALNHKKQLQVMDWAGQFIVELLSHSKFKVDNKRFAGLLKQYKDHDLRISEFASDIILEHFNNDANGCPPNIERLLKDLTNSLMSPPPSELSVQHIPHPRNMSLDELEDHLIELRSKQMNTRGVLRRLLLLHCKNEDLTRANEILSECEKQGLILSPGMRSVIFEMHVKCRNAQKAMDTLDELRKDCPGFKIDEHKIIDFATLLAENGNITDALNLLKNYNAYYEILGGKCIERNCWNFLTAVSNSEHKQKTMDILQTLVGLKFCQINNVLLGPVVRAHLNNNDLSSAVETFVYCTNMHKCTPLQQELMTLLAKRDEQDELREVIDAAKKVHGMPNTMATLLIALACADKEAALRKLLLGQSSQITPSILKSRCKRLVAEDALKPLEVLAKATKKISYLSSVDIYYYILQIHHRKGDYEEALRLYEQLVEDEIEITRDFKMTLINLLDSNGYSIPKDLVPNIQSKQRKSVNLK